MAKHCARRSWRASGALGGRGFLMTRWFLPIFIAILAGLEVDALDGRDMIAGGAKIDND